MNRIADGARCAGWSTAQVPRLVQGNVLPDAPASPEQKQREADAIRAAVEAHISLNGAYEVIPTTGSR